MRSLTRRSRFITTFTPLFTLLFTLSFTLPLHAQSTQPDVDQILDGLDATGKNLKDFSLRLKIETIDQVSGDSFWQGGDMRFKSDPATGGQVRIDLKEKGNGNIVQKIDIIYLLRDGLLIERDAAKKQEIIRKIAQPGEKINFFKLGEGPFPLPIGQDKAEVHRQFDVKLVPPQKDDPKDTVHLTLTPKPGSPMSKRFSTIDLWVDPKQKMPVRIDTTSQDQQTGQSTTFTDIRLNTGMKDEELSLPKLPDGWIQREEK